MRKGFTLIELVVVIALIAILAVSLSPRLLKVINQAKVSKVLNNLSNLRIQLNNFQVENGKKVEYGVDFGEDFDNVFQKGGQEEIPTYASSSLEESSEVYTKRTDEGGWVYFEDTEELYANLPNSVYTGKVNEIWNGESISDDGSGEEETDPENPTDPDEPLVPTGEDEWDDFIGQDNVLEEGNGGYGTIYFQQDWNSEDMMTNLIKPEIWNPDNWEKVYLYDSSGNFVGTYNYGDSIKVNDRNGPDSKYKVILSKKDSDGNPIYVYSGLK